MNDLLDYIANDIKPLQLDDPIDKAVELSLQVNYSHLPVKENQQYIGCIDCSHLEYVADKKIVSDLRLDFQRFFVRQNMIWLEVIEAFAKNQTNLMPVLDKQNQFLGIYEIEDVLAYCNSLSFLVEEGSTLVIERELKDYSMSQITQIVESNNSKVLGVFVSEFKGDFVEVTIKMSQVNLNEIIQTFRRYGYKVVSQFKEDNYLRNLKDRSDYLNKYLDM